MVWAVVTLSRSVTSALLTASPRFDSPAALSVILGVASRAR
jgi:hypothetical protein